MTWGYGYERTGSEPLISRPSDGLVAIPKSITNYYQIAF